MDTASLIAGARALGTPFWAYDAQTIRARILRLKAFDIIRYAQKANSNINILRLMRAEGVLVDAVSLGEIERALAAGFTVAGDGHPIVFTADILDRRTLAFIAQHRVPVNCGSPDMIEQLGAASPGHPVWLRVNPGFGHGHSHKTNTGGPYSKHGIWHTELGDALASVKRHGLRLIGLHMHIGSGVDYRHLERVGDTMVEMARRIDGPLEAISAGGGLSTPYRDGDAEIDPAHYFSIWDETRNAIAQRHGGPLKLEIEPGRYLVAESGTLVAEVRAVKKVGERYFVLIDAGFNELMRPSMYGAYHRISFVTPDGAPCASAPVEMAVAGPLCESGDVFTQIEGGKVEFRTLPRPKVGDYALIHQAGAYGASMSSNYNTRPLAPEMLIDGDTRTVIRERQSVESLIELEAARALI